jgi:P22_AR N-terminal domain
MDEQSTELTHRGAPPIGEEQAVDQRIVPFMGDDLVAALSAHGDIYISLPGMCQALGLQTQGQLQRIQRTDELAKGLRRIPLETRGGRQRTNCLRLDKVALWLAGVETARVKGEFRAKLVAYHEELAPVALRVFLNTAGISPARLAPSEDPRLQALAEQIDTLTDVVTFLREHMAGIEAATGQITGISIRLDQAVSLLESLTGEQHQLRSRQDMTEDLVARIDDRTAHLTPAHKRQVQTFVDRMVRETKQRAVPLTYATIYGRLKYRYQVGSYSEIADEAFDNVMTFLQDMLRNATSGQAPEQGQLF